MRLSTAFECVIILTILAGCTFEPSSEVFQDINISKYNHLEVSVTGAIGDTITLNYPETLRFTVPYAKWEGVAYDFHVLFDDNPFEFTASDPREMVFWINPVEYEDRKHLPLTFRGEFLSNSGSLADKLDAEVITYEQTWILAFEPIYASSITPQVVFEDGRPVLSWESSSHPMFATYQTTVLDENNELIRSMIFKDRWDTKWYDYDYIGYQRKYYVDVLAEWGYGSQGDTIILEEHDPDFDINVTNTNEFWIVWDTIPYYESLEGTVIFNDREYQMPGPTKDSIMIKDEELLFYEHINYEVHLERNNVQRSFQKTFENPIWDTRLSRGKDFIDLDNTVIDIANNRLILNGRDSKLWEYKSFGEYTELGKVLNFHSIHLPFGSNKLYFGQGRWVSQMKTYDLSTHELLIYDLGSIFESCDDCYTGYFRMGGENRIVITAQKDRSPFEMIYNFEDMAVEHVDSTASLHLTPDGRYAVNTRDSTVLRRDDKSWNVVRKFVNKTTYLTPFFITTEDQNLMVLHYGTDMDIYDIRDTEQPGLLHPLYSYQVENQIYFLQYDPITNLMCGTYHFDDWTSEYRIFDYKTGEIHHREIIANGTDVRFYDGSLFISSGFVKKVIE